MQQCGIRGWNIVSTAWDVGWGSPNGCEKAKTEKVRSMYSMDLTAWNKSEIDRQGRPP